MTSKIKKKNKNAGESIPEKKITDTEVGASTSALADTALVDGVVNGVPHPNPRGAVLCRGQGRDPGAEVVQLFATPWTAWSNSCPLSQ